MINLGKRSLIWPKFGAPVGECLPAVGGAPAGWQGRPALQDEVAGLPSPAGPRALLPTLCLDSGVGRAQDSGDRRRRFQSYRLHNFLIKIYIDQLTRLMADTLFGCSLSLFSSGCLLVLLVLLLLPNQAFSLFQE
jgi:hypothetical protein